MDIFSTVTAPRIGRLSPAPPPARRAGLLWDALGPPATFGFGAGLTLLSLILHATLARGNASGGDGSAPGAALAELQPVDEAAQPGGHVG